MGYFSIKTIIDYIMNKFGYTRKQEPIKEKDYANIHKTSFTTIFAKRLANKALSDSKIEVVGTSDRAKFLNEAMGNLNRNLRTVITSMLGFGGVVVVPYVAGGKIYFDNINQDCLIIDKVAGDKITDCTVIAERWQDINGNIFYRNVRYILENSLLTIYTFATKNGQEVPLNSVASWAGFQDFITIQGVEVMPFAYFKCPQDNKGQIEFKGVPITFGAESTIKEIHDLLEQIRDEYGEKAVKIFVDSSLFNADKQLSKVYEKVIGSGVGGADSIEPFDPPFRDVSYYNRLEKLFAQLEQEVGVNSGILTRYESGDRTAFEIKANQGDTFAMVDSIRTEIEHGVNAYLQACELLVNYYGLARFGEWEVAYDWGNLLIEDPAQTFQQMQLAQTIGAVSTAEVRNFIFNKETLEESEKKVAEIKKAEPSIRDLVGLNAG